MSKKIVALVLALTLLTVAVSVQAEAFKMREDFASFDVTLNLPDGAKPIQQPEVGWVDVDITFDETKPVFHMSVAPSEEYEDKSLQDFTDEQKALVEEQVAAVFSDPSIEYFVTPSGNTILYASEQDAEAGYFATMQTVYKGFFFSLFANYPDYHALTEDDVALMHKLVEGTDITPVQ